MAVPIPVRHVAALVPPRLVPCRVCGAPFNPDTAGVVSTLVYLVQERGQTVHVKERPRARRCYCSRAHYEVRQQRGGRKPKPKHPHEASHEAEPAVLE